MNLTYRNILYKAPSKYVKGITQWYRHKRGYKTNKLNKIKMTLVWVQPKLGE